MAPDPDKRRQQRREAQRRWRQSHPDYARQWKDVNPEKVRQQREKEKERRPAYLAANRETILQRTRDAERRRVARIKAQEAQRQRARAYAREWASAHPEETRARKQAWAERNREKVRERKRAYYYRHHEERKYASREQAARRRQDPIVQAQELVYRDAERDRYKAHADSYRADPAKRAAHNEYQNDWRRRERRRLRLGLPRVAAHRPTANERIDNAQASDAFFSRTRTPRELTELTDELAEVRNAGYAAADLRDRGVAAAAQRIRGELERPARQAAAVEAYLASPAGRRLREEIRMDVVARRLRGAPPYLDLEAELRRRAAMALVDAETAGDTGIRSIEQRRSAAARAAGAAPESHAPARARQEAVAR